MKRLAILLCIVAVNFATAKDITVLSNDSTTVAQKTITFTPKLEPAQTGDKLVVYSSDTTVVKFDKNPKTVDSGTEITGKIVDFGVAAITMKNPKSDKLIKSFKVNVLHAWEDGHNKIAHAKIREGNGKFQFVEDESDLTSLLFGLKAYELKKETKAVTLDWIVVPGEPNLKPDTVAQIIPVSEDSIRIFAKYPGNHKIFLRATNGEKIDTIAEFAYTLVGKANKGTMEYSVSKQQFGVNLKNGRFFMVPAEYINRFIVKEGIFFIRESEDSDVITHMIDHRDSQVYSVKTLADGKMWMTQNLRYFDKNVNYDFHGAATSSSDNIGIRAPYTTSIPPVSTDADYIKYGLYYHHDIINQGVPKEPYYDGTEATADKKMQSLCPDGFRMINLKDLIDLLEAEGFDDPLVPYHSSADNSLLQSSTSSGKVPVGNFFGDDATMTSGDVTTTYEGTDKYGLNLTNNLWYYTDRIWSNETMIYLANWKNSTQGLIFHLRHDNQQIHYHRYDNWGQYYKSIRCIKW